VVAAVVRCITAHQHLAVVDEEVVPVCWQLLARRIPEVVVEDITGLMVAAEHKVTQALAALESLYCAISALSVV
jgi:hypothetical protein